MIFNQRNTFWKHFIKMTVKRLSWRRINVTLIKNIEPRIWYRKYMYFFERTKLSEYIIILDCSSYNGFTYLFNEVSEWSKLMLLSCDSQQWEIQPVRKYFWEIFRQFYSVLRKNNLVWEKAILNCRVVECYRSSEEWRAILARVSISSVCFLLSSVEVPSQMEILLQSSLGFWGYNKLKNRWFHFVLPNQGEINGTEIFKSNGLTRT